MPGLQVERFGPFLRGAVDAANDTLDLKGAVRYARNCVMDGVGRLKARPGTQVAMTLLDDDATPDPVTSVVALVEFGDGALAVGHSTVTDKFYLYRLTAGLDGWFNAGGVLQSNTNAQPVGVLWSAAPDPAKVLIAEGLGEAYIAHNNAGANFKSQKYTLAGGIVALQADLRGSGLEDTYFRGFVSFQQHLWGWGYGSQAPGDNDRSELLRFGFPNFGTTAGGYFAQADSFAVGHRVRTASERIVAAVVAGQVLYVGTQFSLWPITGFGRNSWDKSRPLDDSYGFAGVYAAVSANGRLHYWSHRGPLRVGGLERPEPIWDPIATATTGLVFPADVVAALDPDRDQVMFLYRSPTSGRVSVVAAVDTRRDTWLGPDGDIGLGVACAGLVHPTSTAGPAAPPNTPSTTDVGNSVATAHWINGDTSAAVETVVEYRIQGAVPWTVAGSVPVPQQSFQITGLIAATSYEWRAKHIKNGQDSVYLGPVAATQFITTNVLNPPTNCQLFFDDVYPRFTTWQPDVRWTNSGESGVSTEVYFGGPFSSPPASGSLPLVATNPPGSAAWIGSAGHYHGTFYAQVRHVKSGATSSTFSNMASRVHS